MKISAIVLATSLVLTAPIYSSAQSSQQGTEVIINGTPVVMPWRIRNGKLQLSDTSLMYQFGLRLTSSDNYRSQPIDYFGTTQSTQPLTASLDRQYRYLDITTLAKNIGCKLLPAKPKSAQLLPMVWAAIEPRFRSKPAQ
jgi:hypothetical protein